ncbi:MAG: hypothetical protein ACI856_001013, partial [Kiritimatiellia bacterium]
MRNTTTSTRPAGRATSGRGQLQAALNPSIISPFGNLSDVGLIAFDVLRVFCCQKHQAKSIMAGNKKRK